MGKLSKEQIKALRELAPGGTYERKRDKVYHERLQNREADLAGKSYITDNMLFQGCSPEQIELLLSGSVNGLLEIELKVRPVKKVKLDPDTRKMNLLVSILSEEFIDENND